MMPIRSLASFLLRLTLSAVGGAWTQDLMAADVAEARVAPGDRAEQEYQEFLRASRAPETREIAAIREKNNRLYEAGTAFLKKYPAHPRRWDVVVLLNRAFFFSRQEVNEKGETETVRDTERHQSWMLEYRRLATELIAAPDASVEARQKTLEYLIRQYGVNIAEGRARDPLENLKMMARHIDDLRQYASSGILLSSYRVYAQSLSMADPAALLEFLRELPRRHPANSNFDRAIRDFAVGQLRLLEGQATPVWDLLATIDPGFTYASTLQGKVVLIALVPERWAEYAGMLRDVHAKFRGPDFEIIQLSSGGPSFKEFEALEDPGEPPWRVMRDRANLAAKFYSTLGLNTTPSWLIVARDGKFVIDATTRTLTKVLERELALR